MAIMKHILTLVISLLIAGGGIVLAGPGIYWLGKYADGLFGPPTESSFMVWVFGFFALMGLIMIGSIIMHPFMKIYRFVHREVTPTIVEKVSDIADPITYRMFTSTRNKTKGIRGALSRAPAESNTVRTSSERPFTHKRIVP